MARMHPLQFRVKPRKRWDLLAAAGVILLVAGTVVPIADKDRLALVVNQIIELREELKGAAEQHFKDTGRYPVADAKDGRATAQQLSEPQTYAGWNGPYRQSPLSNQDHPLGQAVLLTDQVDGLWGQGFLRSAPLPPSGDRAIGSVLILRGIPEAVAFRVDRTLDACDEGESESWKRIGTVQFRSGSLAILMAPL